MDAAELGERLAAVVGSPVRDLIRVSGGASRETWAFTASGRDLILRRDPDARPSPPGAMAVEAAAIRAAADAGLAVPEIVVTDDGSLLGTAAVIMARVPGEVLARRILRDQRFATARARLGPQLAAFLARLHAVDPGQVPGLAAVDSLRDYERRYAELGYLSPTFELAQQWLQAHRPDQGGAVISHGDLRLGNLIVDDDGLAAVIDWEFVHAGDPLEDLAWLCVRAWRFGSPLPVAGVATLEEFLGAYESESGRAVDPAAFRWWLVQKTLQWGIGCLGQAFAHLSGQVRSVELAAIGRRAAEQEWDLLRLLEPELVAKASTVPRPAGPPAGMFGPPTAAELLESVREFIAGGAGGAGGPDGPASYDARVAINVLSIVERELAEGPAAEERFAAGLARLGATSVADLVGMIRRGLPEDRRPEVIRLLVSSVRDRLAVANPRLLAAEN
jgi:aminoglycoside phosphotransferase (APT) family kinase protein